MPLDGHFSYPETMDEFFAHWELVDGALTPGPGLEVVPGRGWEDGSGGGGGGVGAAVSRGEFAALAGELRAVLDAVDDADLRVRVGAREVALRRERLVEGLGFLNDAVRVWWARQPAAALVPGLPNTGAALDAVLRYARAGLRLWDAVNAGPPPGGVALPLVAGPPPGLDRAGFAALRAGVEAAREALEAVEFEAAGLRARRDVLERGVRAVLSAYVRAVPVRLGADHSLVKAMPRLSPLPGHTPAPVSLQAVWDAEAQAARLTWSASADAALDHYQIRWCAGNEYNKKEERVELTIPAVEGMALTALVRTGLEAPGLTACYKMYVVLKTGNERGSAAVAVAAGGGAED